MAREKGGPWVWFAATIFYPLCRILARRLNTGTEHVPRQGGVLLVMNHVSHLDPVYDAVLVHKQRRVPRFLAKESLFRRFFVRTVLYGAGQIPVYRGSADARDSLRDAKDGLAAGKLVLIYPEGTITKDPAGWPMYSRTGVARLALDTDVPVVPAARWGTLSILDLYAKKFRPFPRSTVTTAIGEPIDLSAYRDRPQTNALYREVTELIMARIAELLGEIRGETPPAQPYRPAARSAVSDGGAEPDARG